MSHGEEFVDRYDDEVGVFYGSHVDIIQLRDCFIGCWRDFNHQVVFSSGSQLRLFQAVNFGEG